MAMASNDNQDGGESETWDAAIRNKIDAKFAPSSHLNHWTAELAKWLLNKKNQIHQNTNLYVIVINLTSKINW